MAAKLNLGSLAELAALKLIDQNTGKEVGVNLKAIEGLGQTQGQVAQQPSLQATVAKAAQETPEAQAVKTAADRRVDALRKINQEEEAFRQSTILEQERQRQGLLVTEKAKTADERRIDALRSINRELEGQQAALTKINLLLKDQGLLRQTVAKGLELERKQAQLSFAQMRERARQQGPLGAIADFFGIGPTGRIGGFLHRAGGTLSGIGDAVGGRAGALLGRAGGFLGGAAAGPVGIAISAALLLAPVVKSLAAAPFKAVASGMAAINKGLAGLNGTLGPIGSILGGTSSALSSLADKFTYINPLLAGMAAGTSAIIKQAQAFLEISVALANKASPGTVRRFTIAVEDTAAVVGHRLVPLVDLMRTVVRGIGDFLQTILPSTQEFREALSPLREIFGELKDVLTPVAHILRVGLSVGLKVVAVHLRAFAKVVEFLIAATPLGALAALAKQAGLQLDTSVGAAARGASFTTPEDYARQVYLAALTSEGANPAQQTADNTAKMIEVLREIRDKIRNSPAAQATQGFIEGLVPGAGAAAQWLNPGGA